MIFDWQIRALYVIILLFCQPSNPVKLFDEFWMDWTEDFKRKGEWRGMIFTEENLKTMVRLDVQVRLKSHEKDLIDFGLPLMSETEKKYSCWTG